MTSHTHYLLVELINISSVSSEGSCLFSLTNHINCKLILMCMMMMQVIMEMMAHLLYLMSW